MRSKNKNSFKILLTLSFILLLGIIAEHTYYALNPKGITIFIDVEKVKEEINNAGLNPVEAKYWKEL